MSDGGDGVTSSAIARRVKVAPITDRTHNPFNETPWVSCLRENLTSSSDGEGLETGLRSTLNGHEGGNLGYSQGQSYGLPRQSFTRHTAKVAQEKSLDGCYIISTDVDQAQMNTLDVVNAYKSLTFVERAFRNLKTVQLEIRPVYHKTDGRIRAHVFLCMLAYYLQWHMEQRLAPLFEADGVGENRRWTFRGVIDCLAQITRNRVSVNGAEFYQNSTPTPEQEQILRLLEVSM